MLRVLPFILYIVLVAYCLADAIQDYEENPHGLPKWAWVIIILLFPYIGAAAWIILKIMRHRKNPPQPPITRAPDDDPDYLRWLRDQERRKRQEGEGN